jgi:transposase-like protein
VKRARKRRAKADADWRNAILSARDQGAPLRAIAAAAGISHVGVIQILREVSAGRSTKV